MNPDPQLAGPSYAEILEFFVRMKDLAEVGMEDEELEAWKSWKDEVPMWSWAAAWCMRRVSVLEARALGYGQGQRSIQAEVDEWQGSRKVLLSTSEDGSRRIYDYPDGRFKAYERAPEISDSVTGFSDRPWSWRRLAERPSVHLVEGAGSETLATAASRQGDAEGAKMFANAEEELFGEEFAEGPPGFLGPLCMECFEEIEEGADFVADHEGASHRSCLPITPSVDEIASRLKTESSLPTTDGRRSSANAPDPQAEIETRPAGIEPRVGVCCTNEECTTNKVMPASAWEGGRKACSVCGAPLMAWSVVAGKPTETADLLEGRAKDGPWPCEACDKPAWMHVNYRKGSPLSHSDCPDFVRPAPANGSICKSCLYVHAWDVSAPAVVNICDSCRAEKKLTPYKGRAQLEELREKHAKKGRAPSIDSRGCENCESPAEIQFARKGKGYPIIYACRPCSELPGVRGRRTSKMEI